MNDRRFTYNRQENSQENGATTAVKSKKIISC